jgi:prepilin-type N-terminal cleavage/methylation domain-containing protein
MTGARNRAGFTLVEMIVVIAILATVSAVTLPSFRAGNDDAITVGSKTLANFIARARQTSIERGEAVTLIVEPESARYWVMENATAADSLLTSGSFELPADAKLVATQQRLRYRFLPSGRASGDPLTLRLGARAAVISVDRWTGDGRAEIH